VPEVEVGKITHYFGKASVAALELTAPLEVGDTIVVRGGSTDFNQTVNSMQIERQDVQRAEPGQQVGIKVEQKARPGDVVYKQEGE